MDEGFIPSISLPTRMTSIAVLTKRTQENDPSELLQAPPSNSNSTEPTFRQLVRIICDSMDFSPSNPYPNASG